jgi:hypothetical protein
MPPPSEEVETQFVTVNPETELFHPPLMQTP